MPSGNQPLSLPPCPAVVRGSRRGKTFVASSESDKNDAAHSTSNCGRPVQLSILIASNRRGLLPCARIAQACSWAGPNLEVVVRDNSGDPRKRDLLAHFRQDNCNIIIAEPCDGLTNFSEVLRAAKGDFVFLLADDDWCFDRAIAGLPGLLDQAANDASVIGVTGAYAVETSQGSALLGYQSVDAEDVAARIAGFLNFNGPNILHYAPVRREVVQRVFAFMNAMPFYFSFHDQIQCLLYLMNGKFVRLQRFMYVYDVANWEDRESGQRQDLKFYESAGLDPVINKLHWFLCGFEGAMLVRNAAGVFPDHPLGMRQRVADVWFSVMFQRFKRDQRMTFDSAFAGEAEKLCAKLQTAAGHLSFHEMLADISDFFGLFSKEQGRQYFEFWDAILGKRQPPSRAVPASEVRRSSVA